MKSPRQVQTEWEANEMAENHGVRGSQKPLRARWWSAPPWARTSVPMPSSSTVRWPSFPIVLSSGASASPLFTCTHSILTNSQLLSNSIWNAHSMLEKLEREIISCWLKKGTRNSGVCYKWFQKGETMSSHSIHSRAPLGGLRRVLFHQDTSLEYKSLGNQRWFPMYL